MILPFWIEERVFVSFEQRLVCVHPRSADGKNRLGHERGVQTVLHRDVPHDKAEGRNIVGRRDRIGVLEIDLMLCRCDFMMRGLDFEAHRFESIDDVTTRIFSPVERCQIEVTPGIVREDGGAIVATSLEQEEFRFRARHHGIPKRLGLIGGLFQCQPWATFKRRAIGKIDVTDESSDLVR